MDVVGQRLPLRVQDRSHADIASEMAGITAKADECGGRGLKEEPVERAD